MAINATLLLLMTEAIYAVIGAVGGLAIGALIVVIITKFRSGNNLSKTERLVAEMKANAENECKALKKEAIVELKEQELKLRTEFEKESREKRAELQKM